MKLKSFAEVEQTIGGRPKVENTKVRMSFYVSQLEAEQLKKMAENKSRPVSQMVRLIMSEYLASHPVQK